MTITALYAAPLALLLVWLSFRVIGKRRTALVAYGPGDDTDLLQRMRIHANFAEYAPFALLLMALAESLSAPALMLHISGLSLLAGRMIHGIGLSMRPNRIRIRVVGMILTFFSIVASALTLFSLATLNAAV